MKKIILLLSVFIMLAGCVQLEAYKQTIKTGGAHIADEALKTTLWKLCNGTSYGAIKRWVGSNKDLGAALKTVCNQVTQADIETSQTE